jgi:hypothetical protein
MAGQHRAAVLDGVRRREPGLGRSRVARDGDPSEAVGRREVDEGRLHAGTECGVVMSGAIDDREERLQLRQLSQPLPRPGLLRDFVLALRVALHDPLLQLGEILERPDLVPSAAHAEAGGCASGAEPAAGCADIDIGGSAPDTPGRGGGAVEVGGGDGGDLRQLLRLHGDRDHDRLLLHPEHVAAAGAAHGQALVADLIVGDDVPRPAAIASDFHRELARVALAPVPMQEAFGPKN